MPRFNCTISFNLRTEVEPDGVYFDAYGVEGVEDVSDDSSWYAADVTSDGGCVTAVIEADSEEEANEKAAEIVNEGSEVEDRNGLTWLIEDISVEVEEIIVPMTLDRAKGIVTEWLSGRDEDDELTEAIGFLLSEFDRLGGKIGDLGREVAELSYKLSAAERKVAELAGELDRLKNGPDGSEAPTEAVGEPA